jgi:hypothetical protein
MSNKIKPYYKEVIMRKGRPQGKPSKNEDVEDVKTAKEETLKLLPISDSTLADALLKSIDGKGISLEDKVSEIIFDYLFKQGIVEDFDKHYIKIKDYNSQAENLLTLMLPYEKDMIKQVIKDNGLPIWQQLLSYVRFCVGGGLAHVVMTSPEWREKMPASETAICMSCHKEFKVKRQGQLYCSNACAGAIPEA